MEMLVPRKVIILSVSLQALTSRDPGSEASWLCIPGIRATGAAWPVDKRFVCSVLGLSVVRSAALLYSDKELREFTSSVHVGFMVWRARLDCLQFLVVLCCCLANIVGRSSLCFVLLVVLFSACLFVHTGEVKNTLSCVSGVVWAFWVEWVYCYCIVVWDQIEKLSYKDNSCIVLGSSLAVWYARGWRNGVLLL